MAANIHIDQAGRASMVSYRENPWHGLGTVVQQEMTDADILRLAMLDWTTVETPVLVEQMTPAGNVMTPVKGYKALQRSDNGRVLSIVGAKYRAVQNHELVAWTRAISTQLGLVWQTAGALGDGRECWVLAEIPDLQIVLGTDDVTKTYMLMVNGHGNGNSLRMIPTTVRVVCQNTMNVALGGRSRELGRQDNADNLDTTSEALAAGYSIKHNGRLDATVSVVTNAYRDARAQIDSMRSVFESLAGVKATASDAAEYWNTVFPVEADEDSSRSVAMAKTREAGQRDAMNRILASPTSLTDTRDTWYSVMQSAIEYIDHERPVRPRQGTSPIAARARRALLGADVRLKKFALDTATEMAGVA